MALGKLELEQEPGNYVSGARARWLIQARRARLTPAGQLRILFGHAHAAPGPAARDEDAGGGRVLWSAYSSAGVRNRCKIRWLDGYHMNGDAVNHG